MHLSGGRAGEASPSTPTRGRKRRRASSRTGLVETSPRPIAPVRCATAPSRSLRDGDQKETHVKTETFSQRRAREERELQERRQRLTEQANASPHGRELLGSESSWAEILGGAEQLWVFKQVARLHGLDVTRPRDFQRAKE